MSVIKSSSIYIIFYLITANYAFGQDCFEYYRECEAYNGKSYQFDDASGSYYLSSDGNVEVTLNAIKGINYKISICSDSIRIPLHFVIKNKEDQLLYNNHSDNFKQEFEFSVDQHKELTIEIDSFTRCLNETQQCSGCVGLIIKKTVKPRTGF